MKASFALTEKGPVRHENQDHFLLNKELGLIAVADGLGGLPNGGRASRFAIDILNARLKDDPDGALEEIVQEVNAKTRDYGYSMDASGFGTTLTLGRLSENPMRLEVAHVGDSGAYLVSDGVVKCLTKEHTVATRMMEDDWQDASDAIPLSAHHTLTQCIGQDLYIQPEVATFPLKSGDRVFLLTDGVTKPLGEPELFANLGAAQPLDVICQRLSFRIEVAGAPDNYTIVAIEV